MATQLDIIIRARNEATATIGEVQKQLQALATGFPSPFTRLAAQTKTAAKNLNAEWTKTLAAIERASGHTQEVLIKHGQSIVNAMALKKGANVERINELNAILKQFSRSTGLAAGQAALQEETESRKAHLTQLKAKAMMEKDLQSNTSAFLQRTGSMMKSQISWFAGAGTIFAVVGGITAAAKATLEFYQNLKNIQAVTGESDVGIRKISAAALEVAKSTPIAASEASKLGLTLIQAGLNSEQAAEAMKTVAAVTTVSGEDMVVVSKAVTTAMFAWHKTAKDIPDIGNSIAAALNFSRLTVTDLGTAFNYLASTSSIMGRSLNETVSIMATLSNAGIRASTIGTGMSQLYTQLLVPTKQMQKELERMGVSQNAINPQMHKFADIVELLASKGFSAGQAMHLLGDRAGRQMAAAMVMGADSFREMEKKIENSKQLQEGLAKAMEGPINAMKNLRNQFEVTAIQIGAVGVPAFNAIIGTIKVASSVLVAATSGFSFLAETIGGGLAAALTAGAIASVALYRHFTMLAASALTTSGAVNVLSVSLAALAKNPYVIAITATITGLVLLGTLFSKNKEKVDELAKAKENLAKHNEEVRKSTEAAAEAQKKLEFAITAVRESWAATERRTITPPFLAWEKSASDLKVVINDIGKEMLRIQKAGEKGLLPAGWTAKTMLAGTASVSSFFNFTPEQIAKQTLGLMESPKKELSREERLKEFSDSIVQQTKVHQATIARLQGLKNIGRATQEEIAQLSEARQAYDSYLKALSDVANAEKALKEGKEADRLRKLAEQSALYSNSLLDAIRDTARLREELDNLTEKSPFTKIALKAQKDFDELQNKIESSQTELAKIDTLMKGGDKDYNINLRQRLDLLFFIGELEKQQAIAREKERQEQLKIFEQGQAGYLKGVKKRKTEGFEVLTAGEEMGVVPSGFDVLERMQLNYNSIEEARESHLRKMGEKDRRYQNLTVQMDKQAWEMKIAGAVVATGMMTDTLGAWYTATGSQYNTLFAIYKTFAIGQAIMSAHLAAAHALAADAKFLGLGAIGTANVVLAFGYAQAAAIAAQSFMGGGGGGAGGGAGGTSAKSDYKYYSYEQSEYGSGWRPGEGQGPGTKYPYSSTSKAASSTNITYNIVANDSKSFAQMVKDNPSSIHEVVQQDIKDNGNTKKVIQQYV